MTRLGALLGFVLSIALLLFSIYFTTDFVAGKISSDGILEPTTINRISIIRLLLHTISTFGLLFSFLILINPSFFNSFIDKFLIEKQNETRLFGVITFLLIIISLLPVWLVEFPPLQDYPSHLVRANIISNFWNPDFGYTKTYSFSFFPTPYILIDYIFLALNHVFSIQYAGKIILSLYVVLLPLSTFYLIQAVDKSNKIIGYFSFILIYNYFFNMGFTNFSLSIPLFLFALGYWWKTKDDAGWTHRAILAILVFLVYICHLFAYCFLFYTVIILSAYFLRKPKKIIANIAVFLPSLILLILSLINDLPTAGTEGFVLFFYNGMMQKLKFASFYQQPAYYMSFDPRLDKIILLSSTCLAACLLIVQLRNKNYRTMAGIFITLLLLFGLYVVTPTHFVQPALDVVDTRILIFMCFIFLLLLGTPKNKFMRSMVCFIVITLSLAHLATIFVNFRSINQDLQILKTAMKEIPPGKRVLFSTELKISEYGRINPVAFFGAYYFLQKKSEIVPPLTPFIGPLRALQYKNRPTPSEIKIAKNPKKNIENKIKRYKKGFLLLASKGENWLTKNIEFYGYLPEFKLRGFGIYQKKTIENSDRRISSAPKRKYVNFGFKKGYDYLLLYNDEASPVGLKNDLGNTYSQDLPSHRFIHIYKRNE